MKRALHKKLHVSNSAAVSEMILNYHTSFQGILAALKLSYSVWHVGVSSISNVSWHYYSRFHHKLRTVGFQHYLHSKHNC